MEVDAEVKHPMLTADSKGLLFFGKSKELRPTWKKGDVDLISTPHLILQLSTRMIANPPKWVSHEDCLKDATSPNTFSTVAQVAQSL